MAPQISELIERIRGLEEELELELARKREELRFERDILLRHKALKTGLLRCDFNSGKKESQ